MIDIIDILNWATRPIHTTEEYRTVQGKSMVYWDAVEQSFSTKFVNELGELEGKKCELMNDEHFARGLWLGLRLGQFAEQGPSGGIRNN